MLAAPQHTTDEGNRILIAFIFRFSVIVLIIFVIKLAKGSIISYAFKFSRDIINWFLVYNENGGGGGREAKEG